MNQVIKVIVTSIVCFAAAISLHAQVTTSSISGRLLDNEGPVQGAVIIAVHTPSGSQFTAVSDRNGAYRINGITPGGPYTVKVECLGYRSIENTGVQAPLGETVTVNNTLEVEAIGLEAAVFTADASDSGMNIDRSGATTSINQRRMNSMPTVNRTLNDIMKLTPQSSSTSNGFAVGGGNYRSSYVTVDGAAFNNAFGIGSNLPAGGTPISLDALELMSVNITPYDVRQSGFTGAAINAVTKSGTNEWHASVYNYYTSDQLQGDRISKDDEGKLELSRMLSNTTGVTVGGPIIKDKLFFFLNAEYSPETSPGNYYVARESTSETAGSNGKAWATEDYMNNISNFLQKEYNYNPGKYQNFSVKSPDWKVLGRIDWNINQNHRLTARFSHTVNAAASGPSSSTRPFTTSDLYNQNRTSQYSLYFESMKYIQNQNFTAAAIELNSRFLDGALNNVARITYSYQNEIRDYVGGAFPSVDIVETLDNGQTAAVASFGLDPYTYGNLRQVHTVVATDEISYNIGINNIIAGLQFEWDDTKNGYMQFGAGYYVYDGWDSFANKEKASAFAVTFPVSENAGQAFPRFQYMQASLYAQDEINISDNFKLTAGLRFELPFYPELKDNYNANFAEIADASKTMQGLRTDDIPKARLGISPRVGFNWDILGNRSLILRGGTGIFTGRIPFVWIVSALGNSNCVQLTYSSNQADGIPSFTTSIPEMRKFIYSGDGIAANSSSTILDKNLKMPTTWKTSLALDAKLPGGIKATIEGVFNKDIHTVVAKKLGYTLDETGIQLPGEPEARAHWTSERFKGTGYGASTYDIQPYYLTNTDGVNGYYGSFTAQLQKDFHFGLSLMAAYTFSESMTINEGFGDQLSSSFTAMSYGKNGSNVPELGHSSFVSPHRAIASITYRIPQGEKGATTLGLFYEGFNHCYYAGQYSYTRRSYIMNDVTGVRGAGVNIYIPTEADLAQMTFVSEENKAAYAAFIEGDKYLSKHRGEYMKKGAIAAPWQSRFSFKFAQDINFQVAGKTNTVQIGFDIDNLANLLNPEWGLTTNYSDNQILSYSSGVYEFTEPTVDKLATTYSTWSMMLSLKYFF